MLMVFLAPGSLNHIANIVKGYAIAIGIAFALWFVWQWWAHRQRERQLELAVCARQAFSALLKRGIQHPDMSEPMVGSIDSPIEMVRYKQFVAAILSSAEEVLLYAATPEWQTALTRQLAPHRSYLGSEEFRSAGLSDCSPALRDLIQRVIKG